jgi:hypothetical protein
MVFLIDKLSTESELPSSMRDSLKAISDLFSQFVSSKTESGIAWDALFIVVLIIRCLTSSFDKTVVPLSPYILGEFEVKYNLPFNTHVDFWRATDPLDFIGGIPIRSDAKLGTPTISMIYYPGYSRFQAYDVILAFWDKEGKRYLYGYQLKEGSTFPNTFAYETLFHRSFLIRGKAPQNGGSVRLW